MSLYINYIGSTKQYDRSHTLFKQPNSTKELRINMKLSPRWAKQEKMITIWYLKNIHILSPETGKTKKREPQFVPDR